jgi:D-beta-D-heptose 7-phosphate kinase/D-beta-D-heptose 1-phosphate adenosyltransferase
MNLLSSKKDLLAALASIKGTPILVVGDFILDRYIWGGVERISQEAPVPIVDVSRVEERLGGAGNTLRNLIKLGADARVCGFIGEDEEGKILLDLLEKEGVSKDGVMIDRGQSTSLKTRVIAQNQHIVRIDRESKRKGDLALSEAFAAMVDAHIDNNKCVVVSDYSKNAVSPALMRKFLAARSQKRLGYGIRPVILDPRPTNAGIYSAIDVAKPNKKEAEESSGIQITDKTSALEAARVLLKKWDATMLVITLGADGMLLLDSPESEGVFLETMARKVFDVSGAGDTVTAIFSACLAVGSNPVVAGELANIGAGIAVSEVGTVAVSSERLQEQIEELF